jgi:hypothetical protein
VLRLIGVALIAIICGGFLASLALPYFTDTYSGPRGDDAHEYTVPIRIRGHDVQRYENETTVCFRAYAGHGGDSISCRDKS